MKIIGIFLVLIISKNASSSLSFKDLEWNGKSSSKVISYEEIKIDKDIDLLLYALKNAYIGADYIDKKTFNRFLLKIENIKNQNFENNVSLCKHLGTLFEQLPDGHFSIWFPKHRCYKSKNTKSTVGDNYEDNKSLIYSVHKFPKKKAILISIKKFAPYEDPRWNGFSKMIKAQISSSNLIIDLRGNSGGDSSRGLELSRLLINNSVKHSRRKIIRKNTPEAWTIYRNSILRLKVSPKSQKESIQHLDKRLKIIDKNRKNSISSNKLYNIRLYEKPDTSKTNFSGRLFILVDRSCASSCEHTLEALKFHPNSTVVGENTLGAIHYGQMGLLRLPSSGIYLNLATQYFELFEKGNFDKVGYSPDVKVPKGKDALEYLFSNILN